MCEASSDRCSRGASGLLLSIRLSHPFLVDCFAMSAAADAHVASARVSRRFVAALAIFASAVSFSLAPSIVHLTVKDSNPFYFGLLLQAAQALVVALFLILTKNVFFDRYFRMRANSDDTIEGDNRDNCSYNLSRVKLHLSYFRTQKLLPSGPRVTIMSASTRNARHWIYVPVLWGLIGSLEYGFFAWSTTYIETAIAATVYELWPVFLVFGIARNELHDAQYRNDLKSTSKGSIAVSSEQKVLVILATVGLIFLLASHNKNGALSIADMISYRSIVGLCLALVAAALASIYILATFVYGRITYYQLIDERQQTARKDSARIAERERHDRQLLLWLTLLGLVIYRVVSLPLNFLIGILLFDLQLGITSRSIIGALIIGAANASGAVLLRVGNLGAPGPGINAMFFGSPILAIGLLMTLGISLPRFDLFVLGAALIIAINILIQLKPDEERDYSRFKRDARPGTRLGFTAFILSIWTFGTVIYLRDEILPSTWLMWPADEYWAVIALSATIFALILGFRIARVTARIGREDELIIGLFRDSEHLVQRGVLREQVIPDLADFDTAGTRELRRIYNSIREELLQGRTRVKNDEERGRLLSIEKQLDMTAHSKQQGRDIVEILSLAAFALVTIGLGLLSRPGGVDSSGSSWNVFVSDVFILLFVSTVAFLFANLFDVRRERETPLLVTLSDQDDDDRLFFRFGRDVTVRHIGAVLISVMMSVVFIVLLLRKWV